MVPCVGVERGGLGLDASFEIDDGIWIWLGEWKWDVRMLRLAFQ